MFKPSSIFYGWWLVLVCLLLGAVGGGVTLYSLSLVASAMDEAFSPDRALIMAGFTAHSLMMGLLAPKLSALMERVSVRFVVTVATSLMGVGFLFLSVTPGIWGFLAVYALLIPAATTSCVSLAMPILLTRWFVRRRGTALGIAGLGTQLGGLTLPPFIGFLMDLFGWRVGIAAMGVVVLVILPLMCWRFMIERPSDIGLGTDGDPMENGETLSEHSKTSELDSSPAAALARTSSQHAMLREAVLSREFWLTGLAFAMLSATLMVALSNFVLFAADVGLPRDRGVFLVSVYAVSGIVFSILAGYACDRFDPRWVLAGLIVAAVSSMLVYAGAGNSSNPYLMLLIGSILIGIPGGGFWPMSGALLARLFDNRIFARIMGAMMFFLLTFGAASPLLSGWAYDLSGSYEGMFYLLAILMFISLFWMPLIRTHVQKVRALAVAQASYATVR